MALLKPIFPTPSNPAVSGEQEGMAETGLTRESIGRCILAGAGFLADAYDLFVINIGKLCGAGDREKEREGGKICGKGKMLETLFLRETIIPHRPFPHIQSRMFSARSRSTRTSRTTRASSPPPLSGVLCLARFVPGLGENARTSPSHTPSPAHISSSSSAAAPGHSCSSEASQTTLGGRISL